MSERLDAMKEMLMIAAESQMHNLAEADAEELGEVIDMIKDLEEAKYYCAITEAMEEAQEHQKKMMGGESEQMYYTPYYPPIRYYDGQPRKENGQYAPRGSSYYSDGNGGGRGGNSSGGQSGGTGSGSYYTEREFPGAFQDEREGRSHRSRRMYMEAKETKQGKTAQMRELEKYMQELAQDVIEMVEDASAEERQYLSKKISALATKLTQVSD